MATGGEVDGTKNHSSEVVQEYTCGVCNKDGRKTEASHYCPECDTCYCKACLCEHDVMGRSGVKRWGIGKGSAPADRETKGADNEEMCPHHDNVKVELYCKDHDVVFCSLCPSTSHRKCTDVIKLSEMEMEVSLYSKEKTSLQREIVDLKNNLKTFHQERIVIQTILREGHNEYIAKVKDFQSRVNKTFEKTIDVAKQLKEKNDRNFEADKMLRKNGEAKLTTLQEMITQSGEKVFSFTFLKKGKELVNQQKELLETIHGHDTKLRLKLIDENYIQETISKMEELCKIREDYPSISVTFQEDNEVCEIVGICQLGNGNMILADASNKKLKLIDDTYTIVSNYEVEATPVAVCTMGKTEVAVAMNNKTIQMVNVDKTFEANVTFQVAFECSDIAALKGELYIVPPCLDTGKGYCTCKVDIHIYNNTGNPIRKISVTDYHSHNKRLSWYITPNEDTGEMYVAKNHSIYYCNSKGEKLASRNTYCGINSMCLVDPELVYVSSTNSDKVYTIKRDGNSLSTLPGQEIETPTAICWDRRIGRLLVGCQKRNHVYLV